MHLIMVYIYFHFYLLILYNIISAIQIGIDSIRLKVAESGSLNDTAFLCEHPGVSVATGSEFQVMVKKGM